MMAYKFCAHEKHGGICERKGAFCNPACPYEEIKELAPVVHGTWDIIERIIENAICSNCGRHFQSYYEAYFFCPNCGARMDGGAKDTDE